MLNTKISSKKYDTFGDVSSYATKVKHMESVNAMSKRLVVKNTVIKSDEIIKIGVAILFLVFAGAKLPNYWILVPIGLLIFYSYDFIKRLLDRKPQIIIDKNGIQICKDDLVIPWKNIKNAQAKFYSRNKEILLINAVEKEFEISLNEYKYSETDINKTIEFFTGKRIESIKDKIKSDVLRVLINKENVDQVMGLFSRFQTRFIILGLLFSLGLPSIAVYLQTISSFPFVFAFGFVFTVVFVICYVKYDRLRFRQKEEIRELTDMEFDAIALIYDIKDKKNKKGETIGYSFLVFITIGIFIISYFASR